MNTRHLHLNILALTFIVALTSCNRYNAPELVSTHNHYKEKSNKQPDEATLAFQQRNRLEAITTKPVQGLQVSPSPENLQPIAVKKNKNIQAVSHERANRINKEEVKVAPVKEVLQNETTVSNTPSTKVNPNTGARALCAIIAIFIPFLGVGLYEGLDGNFWIDLLLTILFYFPGLIFALIVILSD